MVVGKVYKHTKNTDVAIRVRNIIELEDCIEVFGDWYNVVFSPKYIGKDLIYISNDDIHNWIEYDTN